MKSVNIPSMKPGMSYRKQQELEKGVLKDAAMGAAVAAAVASAHTAKHNETPALGERPPAMQQVVEEDSSTEAKVQKWRDKLNAMRQRQGKKPVTK